MVTSAGAKSVWALSLAGALYGFIGVAFPNPSADARGWRLASFAVSGVVYICHIAFEQLRLRTSPVRTAVRGAFGVAIGGFLIAVGAIVHAMMFSTTVPLWRFAVALVAFPVITSVPALAGGLLLAFVLSKFFSRVAPRFQPTV